MIVRTRQGQRELRAFALTDMLQWGYQGLRNVSYSIGEKDTRGIPALHRAARLRAEALGTLQLRCWSGDGPARQRRDSVWQARLFAGAANECQSRFLFWETVGESLAWRNNAYIWKNIDPLTNRIVDWWALHPDQVRCNGYDSYTVTVEETTVDPVGNGPGKYNVDASTVLHLRGHGEGGYLVAPTPIQVFKEALSAPALRQRHEARMWSRGSSVQLAVQFPPGARPDDAEKWKDKFRDLFAGPGGDTTLVVGGGAEIKPIGMTPADAQFVEMANLTVEDAARIMAVPANLLGVQIKNAVPNLEQDLSAWLRFGLGPELERIESALAADTELFGAALTYPKFDTDMFVRGDVKTEAAVLVQLVQAGILTPNEARRVRGLDDLPGELGDIPQITPVGGAPNPIAAEPMPAASDSTNGNGSGQYARERI